MRSVLANPVAGWPSGSAWIGRVWRWLGYGLNGAARPGTVSIRFIGWQVRIILHEEGRVLRLLGMIQPNTQYVDIPLSEVERWSCGDSELTARDRRLIAERITAALSALGFSAEFE